LTFGEYQRESSVENRYLYNQGAGAKTFLTERVHDLGLEVDLSRDRTYDYITGRWWQIDPLADEEDFTSLTPYNYSFNNPVLYNDPYGDCPICPILLPILIEVIVGTAEGAAVAAGGTAAVAGTMVLVENAPAGAPIASSYSPAVGMAMSTSKPGELTSGKFFNSESKPKGANNEKTKEAAKTGQEAHRQEQKKLREQGAETEVNVQLKDGSTVRKDAVKPDGTKVIIKPNTASGQKSAEKREKLMKENGHKTEKIFYDPKDPKYQPGSSTYIGPKK
jgi:RHS repeat-associated protein